MIPALKGWAKLIPSLTRLSFADAQTKTLPLISKREGITLVFCLLLTDYCLPFIVNRNVSEPLALGVGSACSNSAHFSIPRHCYRPAQRNLVAHLSG